MNNTVLLKTNAVISNAAYGLNKLIINFPGGLQNIIPNGIGKGIMVNRKTTQTDMKFRVYNGELKTVNNNGTDVWTVTTETDSFGNTVRTYDVPYTYYTDGTRLFFRVTVGTTRVEICDCQNYTAAGYCSSDYTNKLTEGIFNIEQLAIAPFNNFDSFAYAPAEGDLASLKSRSDITFFRASGTNITGDIANLAPACANQLTSVAAAYNPNIYGELTNVLDGMKNTRLDLRGKTGEQEMFNCTHYMSKITYKGVPLSTYGTGIQFFYFDESGDYYLVGVEVSIDNGVVTKL